MSASEYNNAMSPFHIGIHKPQTFLYSNEDSSASGQASGTNGGQNQSNENSASDSESSSSSEESQSESEEKEVNGNISGKSSNSESDKSSSDSESESEKVSEPSVNVEQVSNASNSELDSAGSGPEYNGIPSSSESDIKESRPRPKKSPTKRKQEINSLKQLWEENPEEFGIRRSGRSRKGPARYNDSDGSDSGERGSDSRPPKNKKNKQSMFFNSPSDSDCEDNSCLTKVGSTLHNGSMQFARKMSKPSKKISKQKKVLDSSSDDYGFDSDRKSSGSRHIKKNSRYTESADITDSDDLLDVEVSTAAEEEIDIIEKVVDHRIGKKGATGGSTTVYAVNDYGDPNEIIEAENEEQYLIKWKNWAHLHNTWESEASLKEQKVQGLKKLQNYMTKLEQIAVWKSQATPEDLEYYECQQEVSADVKTQHLRMERIIATQLSHAGDVEYYCKWVGLPYSDCTWEDETLTRKMFSNRIEEYRVRQKSVKIPNKACEALKIRPKFVPLTVQPDYIGGPNKLKLRDYQLDGVNWLASSWCKRSSVILADEMGLGKTIQTISFLNYLFSEHAVYGPFLLVVPLSTMTAWQREFEIWAPEMNVIVYVGDVTSRSIIRQHEWCHPGNKRMKFNALITTYELLSKDKTFLSSIHWAVLGVDEAHRLKNEDSLLYKSLCEFHTNHRLLITGTPLQNSLRELYALLHFIMPLVFPSWIEFEEEHKDTADKGYPKLHKQLVPYLLRRVKKDVEKSLPAKVERILRVEMTTIQKQYYKWILTKNYKALSKGLKGNQGSFNNIIMELKKCCNHAMLIRPVDNPHNLDYLQLLIRCSGKLLLLDKLLCRLKETGHRVLIFSQMVRMLDILSEYLQLRHFSHQRLDGSIKGELRKQAMDHFNAEGSQDFCFLLSTRAGGLGINLTSADTVVIFDSDWNPQNDLQAQARAHRIGQKNQVNIYRLVTKGSVEEDIIERAKKKMVLDHLVIQRMDTTGRTVMQSTKAPSTGGATIPFNKEELSAILKFGAEELFKEDKEDLAEPQVDIDEILSRAEYREEEQPTSAGEELLSAFKIASVNFKEDEVGLQNNSKYKLEERDWDDIIPEFDRKRIEAEERQKEELDLYLPPRNRKSVKRTSKFSENEASEGEPGSRSDKDDSDEDKPKKRGRPRIKKIEAIKNFTDAEIKRFLKSYKKFAMPLTRLESIAMDADLQGKSRSDLIKVGELIKNGCDKVMKEYMDDNKENKKSGPKKRGREKGPSFKVGGISINAKTLYSNEVELEPLGIILPFDPEERKRWILSEHVRDAHFGVTWAVEDDSRLLRGVYKHGMGNWEAIKMDPELELGEKILPDGEQKPQSKHLQARCDYLLKVLKKMTLAEPEQDTPKAKRGRKPKADKAAKEVEAKSRKPKLSKAFVENDESDVDVDSAPTDENDAKVKADNSILDDKSNKEELGNDAKTSTEANPDTEPPKKKKSKSKKSSKEKGSTSQDNKGDPPSNMLSSVPDTASSRVDDVPARDFSTDSPMFLECKEQMRPVKKFLHKLSQKECSNDEEEKKRFVKYIIKIGRRISTILKSLGDSEKVEAWRGNLWEFVSHFTQQDAKQLYKTYRQALQDLEYVLQPPPGKNLETETKPSSETIIQSQIKVENDTMEASPVIDASHIKVETHKNHNSGHHHNHSLPQKRPADEGSSKKHDRPPKKKHKSSSKEKKHSEKSKRYSNDHNRDQNSQESNSSHSSSSHQFSSYVHDKYQRFEDQQPPPAHFNHNQKPMFSHYPEHHHSRELQTDARSSQGHADSWKRN
ncbi:hypothetical protein JTE90_013762 [Oedothorax gibbosus]|uniref:Chromodomain-helicase-DNA-binding protein 1 n=1 Tax=Oedothorax gibbosus TaxID=931172 RepID=A0AAV6UZK9_9ARAC|nr:hypothetical protein JTE90_013762 [Oedothorax gibbosus]